MADIAHIAGLIAAGLHPSPVDYCDVITSTTHKTLRGARGGIIMTNDLAVSQKVDKWVFPGYQGGPLFHVIAGKAVAFGEALKPEFKLYQQQVVNNAKAFCKAFQDQGIEIVSGGTDNHLFMINVYQKFHLTGQQASDLLAQINIVVNKNAIPFDPLPPNKSSGIRVGTPAMTTRGFKEKEFIELAQIIIKALTHHDDPIILEQLKKAVQNLNDSFPIV